MNLTGFLAWYGTIYPLSEAAVKNLNSLFNAHEIEAAGGLDEAWRQLTGGNPHEEDTDTAKNEEDDSTLRQA